jgi:hypothetical protein
MAIIRPSTPGGGVIFCDDIRQELYGKVTYVGIYAGGELHVHSPFPVLVPKLAIAVTYYERRGESGEPVSITVQLPWDAPDTPAIRMALPAEQLREVPMVPDAAPDDFLMVATIFLSLSPFQIQSEGRIKVRAWRGADEVRLGSLMIRSSLSSNASPPHSEQSPPAAPVS